jgi:uncharacterized protein (TIGR02246 family)
MKTIALTLLLASLSTSAFAGGMLPDKQAIQALENKLADAANRQDAGAAAALYATNGTLIATDGHRFDGRAAVKTWWAGASQGLKDVKLTTVDVISVTPGLLVEDGTFTAVTRGDNPPRTIGGVYNMLWRKTAKGWEIVTDISH